MPPEIDLAQVVRPHPPALWRIPGHFPVGESDLPALQKLDGKGAEEPRVGLDHPGCPEKATSNSDHENEISSLWLAVSRFKVRAREG